ncbi:MAG: hypothetical protein EOP46_03340 [Sphingobacteriaceae bacterium]|nr:MAG: hypothetical protein EOP46_03340 [Sphingobacteriaceae bacterium]
MKLPIIAICILSFFALHLKAQNKPASATEKYEIGVYYFPNYHLDKRNEKHFTKGWSEWKLVKEAKPRFEGHQQPKVPLWGYTDEADPKQMAQKIKAASSNGITAFIFDWYYYDDGPFLERGLEEGFMKASNNNLMKFSLMWANHDWTDIHPYTAGTNQNLLYPGKTTPATWDKMTDYIIAKYFKHPSYWKIDGCPYFSIYDLGKFLESFGSTELAAKALSDFRTKAKTAGFKDLNINAVVWGSTILPGEKNVADPNRIVKELGFNSVTDYVWIHHVALAQFPTTAYDSVKNEYFKYALSAATNLNVPYYPNVSMGWDSSPRTNPAKPWGNSGYPYTPVITGNTPVAFEKALTEAKVFMDTHLKGTKILTINSWNEWTEGSYLEPDTKNKMGYLKAIKAVFGHK